MAMRLSLRRSPRTCFAQPAAVCRLLRIHHQSVSHARPLAALQRSPLARAAAAAALSREVRCSAAVMRMSSSSAGGQPLEWDRTRFSGASIAVDAGMADAEAFEGRLAATMAEIEADSRHGEAASHGHHSHPPRTRHFPRLPVSSPQGCG